jgi:hypothetical protein
MNIKRYLHIVFIGILLASCGDIKNHDSKLAFFFNKTESKASELSLAPKSLSRQAYLDWLSGNQDILNKENELNGTLFHLNYIPAEVNIIRDTKDLTLTQDMYDSLKSEYSSALYFKLNISIPSFKANPLAFNINDQETYQKRLSYYAFDVKEDLQLMVDDHAQPCKLVHYERSYTKAPYIEILMAFDKPDFTTIKSEDVYVKYNDKIFENGPMKFHFNKYLIMNSPLLNLENKEN